MTPVVVVVNLMTVTVVVLKMITVEKLLRRHHTKNLELNNCLVIIYLGKGILCPHGHFNIFWIVLTINTEGEILERSLQGIYIANCTSYEV